MSVGRRIVRQIAREEKRKAVSGRLQAEAASRPESKLVHTTAGDIWMSPIEFELYEAMCQGGLSPIPQFHIRGYYADFAFPDVRVAVEADGAAFHSGEHREHDRKRDWILSRAGWTVKRFHGTTIHHKAADCAYVIKREVEGRRMQAMLHERQEEMRRQARRAAILRPFRKVAQFLTRRGRSQSSARTLTTEPPPPKPPN